MASFSRGQPPAWYTKVVDNGLGPLKPVCMSQCVLMMLHPQKPALVGRDVVDHAAYTYQCVVSGLGLPFFLPYMHFLS